MKCPRCQIDKDPSGFAKNQSHPSGYNYYCRPCHSAKRFERLGRGPLKRGYKATKDWDAPIRVCNTCKVPKPKEEYFRERGQCKECTEKVRLVWVANKRKLKALAARKGCVMSRRIDLMEVSPRTKVVLAMEDGATSQSEIQRATGLRIDEVCDSLADLYDHGRLDRQALRQRVYLAA